MLTILGRPRRVCSGPTRRELLQAGGAGLLGLSVPKLLAAEQATPFLPTRRAKSVIFLFLFGGPSQLETFDMKSEASSSIRGPFRSAATRTPGLQICELLPKMAALSEQWCLVRSMTHPHNDHNASHYIQTGHKWTRSAADGQDVNARESDWPAMGSVVEYLGQHHGRGQQPLPDYMYLPNRLGHMQGYDRTGQYAGWLGQAYNGLATDIRGRNKSDNPFFRNCTDDELDFRMKGLLTADELPLDRMRDRLSLLEQFDDGRRQLDRVERYSAFDRIRDRAAAIVASDTIRTALDIRREPAAFRDRYGRHLFGQSALMGRRLVEAGCRFVTVAWDAPDGYSWDSHVSSTELERYLLPGFDQAYSALIADLADRGLLDETLVVALGEMGRTPKGTPAWGRGHWSYCFPAILAGAGIRGGAVFGASDREAAYPVDNPVSPEDLAATIYHALGINPRLRINDRQGRPIDILEGGRALLELFG